jgi:DNA-nicking Smr family endonuclease
MSKDDDNQKGGSLADQLAGLDVEVAEEEKPEPEPEPTDDQAVPVEPEPKSDEELFKEALEGMSEEDVRRAKYDEADEPTTEPEPTGESESTDDGETARVHAEESGDGRMADQLSGLDVEVREAPEEPEPEEQKEPEPTRVEPSPEEQFERALDGLSRTEMRRQKYDLPTAKKKQKAADEEASDEGDKRSAQEEQQAREELKRRREQRKFQAAMRDVDRMETSKKYRQRSKPDPSAYLDEEDANRTADDFVTRRLPKSGEGLNDIAKLDDAQEAMLERFEQWKASNDIRELNLRGETADDAVVRLRGFIQQCVDHELAFARIIHGRGENSTGPPVVKPTVLEWLEDHGAPYIRGYVPERKFGGDYGSLVVEFRR